MGPDTSEHLRNNIEDLRHGLMLVGRDLDTMAKRNRKTTRSRLSLLHIHSITAILVGLGVIANGQEAIQTPAYVAVRAIPGAPMTVGLVLVALGVVLGVATLARHIPTEIVALIGMAFWYLLWATSFLYAVIAWNVDPSVGQKPSYQGMFAYYGWAALLIAHIKVLFWLRRRERGAE